tara:strand:- start:568 stop:747 length:180 start_codon:yes stop_codon:yes gene_type:complete
MWVAILILQGVAKEKKENLSFPLIFSMLVLNRFFRFIRWLYQVFEYQKYKIWLKKENKS